MNLALGKDNMEKLNSYQKYTFRVENRNMSRLIENVEIGINMALIQSERIVAGNASIELPRVSPGPDTFLFLKLFTDIHFYLVSVANIKKFIGKLNRALDDTLDDINKDYRNFFDTAKAVRNCQEHLDERIESGKYYGKSLYDDWVYEICGKTVVIGPPAAKILIQLYRELDLKLETLFPKKASKD